MLHRHALKAALAALLLVLTFGHAARAQIDNEQRTPGGACGASASPAEPANEVNADWDTIMRCSSGAWQRAPYYFGNSTDSCDASHAGLTRYSSGNLQYCNSSAWTTLSAVGTLPLSGLTGATATNTRDHANYAQTWTWNTLTTGTAMTLSSSSMTTGTLLALSNTSTPSNAGTVLSVSNSEAGASVAISGTSTSTGAGDGVFGQINGASNSGYGVYGTNAGSSNTGAGVFGSDGSSSGYGGYFVSSSANGTALYSANTATGNGTGYAGYFTNSGTGGNYGVYAATASKGAGYGVYGTITGANNTGSAGYFSNTSTAGYALQTSGISYFSSADNSVEPIASLNIMGNDWAQIYDGANGGLAIGGGGSITTRPSSATMFWNVIQNLVGIGTTAPNQSLEVWQNISVDGGEIHTAANSYLILWPFRDNSRLIFDVSVSSLFFHTAGGTPVFEFGTSDTGSQLALYTNNAEALRITSTGSVGIGTTSPTDQVDLTNNQNAATSFVIHNTTNGAIAQAHIALISNSGTFDFGINSTAQSLNVTYGDAYIWNEANTNLIFGANNGEKMRLTNGGYLGIGTVSPQAPLDVSSTTANILALSGSNGNATRSIVVDTSGTDVNTNIGGAINFIDDGAYGANITFSEHTGAAGTAQTERMRINTNGRVGIGTTSPANTLDVNGTIHVATLATASATTICRNANVLASCSSSIRYKEKVKDGRSASRKSWQCDR